MSNETVSKAVKYGGNMTNKYIHGYDTLEQDRLVSQAAYWMDLILTDISFHPGDCVLEIGCGVGAVLGILGHSFPEVQFSGIDISEKQIASANSHLSRNRNSEYELKVGDAKKLPWDDSSFDHVFMIWVIEHLDDPTNVFMEANRVLRTGGTITITETDYSTIQIYPLLPSVNCLFEAFVDYFNINGDPFVGRKLGRDIDNAGFVDVNNKLFGLNFWNQRDHAQIHRHTNYIMDFVEPLLKEISESTACDLRELERGVEAFRTLSSNPDATLSHVFYKATGTKA